jgi:hypothetical protein
VAFDKPLDRPFDRPLDKPFDKPFDRPLDKPFDKPFDRPLDKPFDVVTEPFARRMLAVTLPETAGWELGVGEDFWVKGFEEFRLPIRDFFWIAMVFSPFRIF